MYNNLPLVSIGLPIFNRPEGLIRSLECLVNQTYQNIEIVIADNCSTNPEVEKIAREYVAKDARITYYRHDSNKGWGYNTNFVIEKAKGDYFMRATDDDWWDITFVEKVMKLMKDNPEAVLGFSNYIAVDQNEIKSDKYPSFLPLLQEFTVDKKVDKIRNYIEQFEGFGKSNLYFSIYKIELLKSDFVIKTLKNEVLAGDLQINLFCLLRGNFCLHEDELFRVTFGNEKLYDLAKSENKLIDLYLIQINFKKFKSIINKWNPYLFSLYSIVRKSDYLKLSKLTLYLTITKRILFFYYDTICISCRTRGIDIFLKLKRKNILE